MTTRVIDPLRLRKFLLGLIVLIAAVAGAIFVNSVNSALEGIERTSLERGTALSRSIVEHEETIFEVLLTAFDEVSVLARESGRDLGSVDPVRLGYLLRFAPGAVEFRLLDADGTTLARVAREDEPPARPPFADLLARAKNQGGTGTLASPPYRAADPAKWRFDLAKPIAGDDGRLFGLAVLMIDLDRFRADYARLDVGAYGTIGLWRDDAVLLTRHPFDEAQIGRQVTNRLLTSFRGGAKSDSIVIVSAIDGTQRQVNWARMDEFPLIVTVAFSTAEYREALYSALKQQSIAVVLGAILIPLLALTMWISLGRMNEAIQHEQRLSASLAEERAALRAANRELSLANERVIAANKVKSDFLANVSHELRTPLNAIVGFSELMRAEMFGPLQPRYLAYLDDIGFSARHLSQIVSDILDLHRIEAGAIVPDISTFDLREVAADCARMLDVIAARKRIAVELVVPERPVAVASDRQRVLQIAINLLSNAIKYSDEDGRVVLRIAAGEGSAALSVEDRGIGMSERDIALALQPFQQSAIVRNRSADSIGLGLPIVRALTEALGATLTFDSRMGAGTTVCVRFPSQATA